MGQPAYDYSDYDLPPEEDVAADVAAEQTSHLTVIEGGQGAAGADAAAGADTAEGGGAEEAVFGGEKRVQGDPRGPRGPPHPAVNPQTFLRLPNRAVPTRTQVEPSSMAVSRSWDMPMESSARPCACASSRSFRKYPRGASGSSDQGGIVIRPRRWRLGHARTA